MDRSRLKNKFLRNRIPENWSNYKKQRNLCVSLFRKKKKAFYRDLDVKSVIDNKKFWKVAKPSFSDKMRGSENITLIENEEIVYEGKKISEIFNEFFGNAVINLNIPEAEYSPLIIEGETNTVSIAIKRYEKHPSIEKIKNTAHQIFSFQHVSIDEIKKEIMNLDHTKASQDDIPVKLLKANADILYVELLLQISIIT